MARTLSVRLCCFLLLVTGAAAQQQPRDFSREQARESPAWVSDAVIYQIFPRNFSPEGNFNAITAQLDRLKELGVTILWLMPIHPIGQEKKKGTIGSPYAVRDYYAINPDYGVKEDLQRLVRETHRRGMKIIIDIVANHTSWDSVMMKTPEFYTRDSQGRIQPPVPDWADVADLNYENPKLRDYIIDMLKYWLREFDLDGFRCDVAGFVPTDFWERARTELEKIKPDIVMLAEWHSPDLMVKAFDLDYAWPFHSAIMDVIFGTRPATALRETWIEERAKFPRNALHMRFSDNHDERRAIVRFGERAALAASALVFTMDGAPLLYNGMEVGDTTESGAPALFEKLPVFWQIAERRPEFPRFYKQIIALRRQHAALRQGETEWLKNSDDARIVTFVRRADDQEVFVAINLSNRPFVGFVEVATGTKFLEITPYLGNSTEARLQPVGLPALALDAWGYRIFRRAMR
jgi:cyclomaltodextrinase / maltogenic alpha-amylase / neopullulanase